jgi:adenylate cyclase
MLLNFRGKEFTFAPVKFVNILESINRIAAGEAPLYPPDRFKDKIVLVGIHAEGYEDAHPIPLSDRFPGVELHATALDNLLHSDALVSPALGAAARRRGGRDHHGYRVRAAGSGRAARCPIDSARRQPGRSAVGLDRSRRRSTCSSRACRRRAAIGAFLYRLIVEGKQKRAMHRAFRSYLAPEVLREVLRNPDARCDSVARPARSRCSSPTCRDSPASPSTASRPSWWHS